jgi:hypothetical protein
MSVRRILATALLAAAMLGLASCGGGSSVADPPISSAPSSSPAAPQRESPEHFIRRFYAEEQRMENTGQVDAYATLANKCVPCRHLERQVSQYYGAGGFIHWDGYSINSMRIYDDPAGPRASYVIRYFAKPTRYRASSDSPIRRLAGGPSVDVLTLVPTRTTWKVVARGRVSS